MNPSLRGVLRMMAGMNTHVAEAMLTYGAMLRRKGQATTAMSLGIHDGTARAWGLITMTEGEPNVVVWLPVEVADRWEAL